MSVSSDTLEIMPLGGLGEIGLNMLLFRSQGRILVIDCGLMFPEEEHLGVDIIIPDFSYLLEHRREITGVVLTHGHEDHIGALPYLLDQIPLPLYGTPLTLGLVKAKLKEFSLEHRPEYHPIHEGDQLDLGVFKIEPVAVSHSIADGVGLAIDTPAGLIIHSGDFKLDPSPVDGRCTDLERFRSFGDKGVTALLSDSTNAEQEGTTPSETSLRPALSEIISRSRGRVIVATFASHLHRLQQVVDIAAELGKKILLNGRSMVSISSIAAELGYFHLPASLMADMGALRTLAPDKVVILTTGSQGEPLSALSRMAVNNHKQITIQPGDTVIISARVIPGHEKAIARTINNLYRRGAEVLYRPVTNIHVSGHASREELQTLISAVRPRYLIPIHGEFRHLAHHAALAEKGGLPRERILLAGNGDRLLFDGRRGSKEGKITAGRVLVDGKGYGDIHDTVLRDRRHLARDGVLVVIIGINKQTGEVLSGPDIIARGVVFEDESPALLEEAKEAVCSILADCGMETQTEWSEVQIKVRKGLRKFIDRKVARRPLILPTIIEI